MKKPKKRKPKLRKKPAVVSDSLRKARARAKRARAKRARAKRARAKRTRAARPKRSVLAKPRSTPRLRAEIQLVKNFRHIKLSHYAKELDSLRGKRDHLLVFSESKRDSTHYYLSTLHSAQKTLRERKKSQSRSAKSHDSKIKNVLKSAAAKIPVLHTSVQYSPGGSSGGKTVSVPKAAVFLHVKNAKPASLVVSQVMARESKLPSEVKKVLLGTGAAPGESRPGRARAMNAPQPAGARDNSLVNSGREHIAIPVAFGLPGNSTLPPPNGSPKGAGQRAMPPLRDAVPAAPSPTAYLPVYPEIEVRDAHPVQGTETDVIVSLNFQPAELTAGTVAAPHDEEPHLFDVHLLLGKFSIWKKLKFQRPMGTTEKASFKKVAVPTLGGNEELIHGHAVFDISVNFYLEGRWCGEAVRRIEVLAGKDSDKLAEIVTPEAPPWRRDLRVAPGTEPPDLLIRISKIGPLEFEWTLFSPYIHFGASSAKMRMSLADTPYRFVKDTFEIFAGSDLTDAQIRKLNARCDLVFQAAPQGFREAYRELAAAAAKPDSRVKLNTIQIVSDDAYIPWELMRVSDVADSPAFEPEILCVKHNVGRWMASDSSVLGNRLDVETIAVSASDYKTQNVANLPPLPWAEDERKFLVAAPYNARNVALELPVLIDFLEKSSAEMIHFSCHGSTDVQVPDQATLATVDDATGLEASLVASPEVRAGVGKNHPVVFLNACQAAGTGNFLGMVFGWPQAFLRMGATACIAPLWKVVDQRAREIAETFYKAVLLGADGHAPLLLGEALRQIRAQWREKKSITYLGYVLYGDPTTRLFRKP